MKMNDFMNENYIKLNLESQTKEGVIFELAQILNQNGVVDDLEKLVDDIMIRESLNSTGIGLKLALPHAKTEYIKKPSVAFGRSTNGIDFDSMDKEKAELFFLICMPEDGFNLHLKVLAMLSRSLIHESFRRELELAKTPQEVMKILARIE